MGAQVSGKLRKLDGAKLASAMQRSCDAAGILLEGEVISRANENVDTGRHKGSITWRTVQAGSSLKPDNQGTIWPEDQQSAPKAAYEVHVGTAVHYAPHLEYGHKTKGGGQVKAYPHFRSALEANKVRAVKVFQKFFQKFIGAGA